MPGREEAGNAVKRLVTHGDPSLPGQASFLAFRGYKWGAEGVTPGHGLQALQAALLVSGQGSVWPLEPTALQSSGPWGP